MRRRIIASIGMVVGSSVSLAAALAFGAEPRPMIPQNIEVVPFQGVPAIVTVARDGKPLRNADGSYPILLESMRQGQVTEITPDVVSKWGELEERIQKGARYWVIRVDFRHKFVFGKAESSAEAWIRKGRVEKWLYTASGEVVP
jgi:hypothetical protein